MGKNCKAPVPRDEVSTLRRAHHGRPNRQRREQGRQEKVLFGLFRPLRFPEKGPNGTASYTKSRHPRPTRGVAAGL